MGVGVSKTKLAQAMLEILLQLPEGATNLSENNRVASSFLTVSPKKMPNKAN